MQKIVLPRAHTVLAFLTLVAVAAATPAFADPHPRDLVPPAVVTIQTVQASFQQGFTFVAPLACPCTLTVVNGDGLPGLVNLTRVTAGSVAIDGQQVIGPQALNAQAQAVVQPLTLSAGSHSLEATVTGAPGTYVTLRLSAFIPVPDLPAARAGHRNHLLPDGRWLTVGGHNASGGLASLLTFDPETLTWTTASSLGSARAYAGSAITPDGFITVMGGESGGTPITTGEAIALDAFGVSGGPALLGARTRHSVTTVADGRLLVIGGSDSGGMPLSSIEVIDPRPDPFSDNTYSVTVASSTDGTFALLSARTEHSATLLPDGRVVVIGGRGPSGLLGSMEVIDPVTGFVSALPITLNTARAGHTATRLPDGGILIAGGTGAAGELSSVEIVSADLQTVTVSATQLTRARGFHAAALMPWGDVLISGGLASTGPTANTELLPTNVSDVLSPTTGATFPAQAAVQVDRGVHASLTFSEPLDVTTFTANTVQLLANGIDVPAAVILAEDGVLGFVLPAVPLPAGAAIETTLSGVLDVAGRAMTASLGFSIVPQPGVLSVWPDRGPPGTTVALDGTALGSSVADVRVQIGDLPALVTAATPQRVDFTVPATALSGPQPIVVRTRGGTAAPSPVFTLEDPPVLTGVEIFPRGFSRSVGEEQTFTATARYSDSTSRDVAATASWSSSDAATLAVDATGRATAQAAGSANVTVAFGPYQAVASIQIYSGESIPPDPSLVAPELDPGVVARLDDAVRFLIEGEHPIQRAVDPAAFDERRFALVRGTVTLRDSAPLAAVRVSIPGQTGFGYTLSRLDGGFDLVMNGGAPLTIRFERVGYLPVDRTINPRWHQSLVVPPVVLVPFDSQVTAIDLTSGTSQIARGTVQTDVSGSRQATLLFKAGTTASMKLPDGSTQSLTTLDVRATEFTVGASGPQAMPATLPPTSGYTYAVEFSVDQAVAASATEVLFDRAVPIYVENFLHFPVGQAVPAGYYDRAKAAWIPAPNGRVIAVLSETGGLADLDIDGFGQPANASALTALGIDAGEQQHLATLYEPGQNLWRVPITHFSSWDLNWANRTPPGAQPPPSDGGDGEGGDEDNPDCESGSIIECQNQALGETIPITGAPFSLHYRSSRAPGRATRVLTGRLTGAEVPAGVKRVVFEVEIAGRYSFEIFGTSPLQRYRYEWDGRDAYGRDVHGSVPVTARVGYVYDTAYSAPANAAQSFALPGTLEASGDVGRSEFTIWTTRLTSLGTRDLGTGSNGGWSIGVHHAYDPYAGVVYRGDGRQQSANKVADLEASNAAITSDQPRYVAAGPDGSVYSHQDRGFGVKRVRPDGTIETLPTVIGTISAIGSDGSLYHADYSGRVIRRRKPDGQVAVVAGNGLNGFAGDGGLATAAKLSSPYDVAVAPDGTLFVADHGNSVVRRVGPDGIISTYAGTPLQPGFAGDGGPALEAKLSGVYSLALDQAGNLIIADWNNRRVRRVGTDGMITTIAGNGTFSNTGDGGPATSAGLDGPVEIDVARDGTLYISDWYNRRVRFVSPDGIIRTFAGSGAAGTAVDKANPLTSPMGNPGGVAVSPDGNLYYGDTANRIVRRVGSRLPGISSQDVVMASPGGEELFVFDRAGRHLRTLDSITGVVQWTFQYDTAGRLIGIQDVDGNLTRIARPGRTPTAIVAPGGQRTSLRTDAAGSLVTVVDPQGQPWELRYDSKGLLTSFTPPRGHLHAFAYDNDGRLTRDDSPDGGFSTVVLDSESGAQTTTITTAEGREREYLIETLADRTVRRLATAADGTTEESRLAPNATRTATLSDGSSATMVPSPDPRWGMDAPLPGALTFTTPAGLTSTIQTSRQVQLSNASDPFSLTQQTDQITINSRVFQRIFNKTANTVVTKTPTNRTTTNTLDAKGRVVQTSAGWLTPVSFTYDGTGLLTGVTQGARTSTITYDSRRRPTVLRDALGREVTFTYDDADRVIAQELPDGRVIGFTYDANGNVTAITPPGRSAHRFTFTPVDLAAGYSAPGTAGAVITTYTYNRDRQLTGIDRPGTADLSFVYDIGGRLNSVDFDGGSIGYGYDTAGRLSAANASNGVNLTVGYDGPLPLSESWSGGVAGLVSRTFNANFLVTQEQVNNGWTVSFGYDTDGLLTQAGDLTLTRDTQLGVVTGSTLGQTSEAFTYTSFGDPQTATATVNTAEVFSVQYTRDALGRITQRIERVDGITRTFEYGYDSAGRLERVLRNGAVIAQYVFDSNGNHTQAITETGVVTATYDDEDRLLTYGNITYTYTPSGELATKSANGQTTSYTYDALGNLTGVALPDGRVIRYVVDGRGRRVQKYVNEVLERGWLWADQLRPIAELDGTGTVIARYIYGSRPNVPDYIMRGTDKYRVFTDHLGSPRVIVDATTGTVAQRLDFGAFGELIQDTNPGWQPFGFAGGLSDPDTGFVRFGVRDYHAASGRWTSKDPSGFNGSDPNLYRYAHGDPTNLVDPTGHIPIPVVLAIVWWAVETGMTVADGAAFAESLLDPCATTADRAIAGGAFLAGIAAPGGFGGQAGRLRPIREAAGPHTVWRRDAAGTIRRHETFVPNPRNPNGWDSIQNTDMAGRSHQNSLTGEHVPTPHTQGRDIPGGVRPALPSEIPGGRR